MQAQLDEVFYEVDIFVHLHSAESLRAADDKLVVVRVHEPLDVLVLVLVFVSFLRGGRVVFAGVRALCLWRVVVVVVIDSRHGLECRVFVSQPFEVVALPHILALALLGRH